MSDEIYRLAGEGRSFGFGPMRVVVKAEGGETGGGFALVEAIVPAGLPGPPRHRHPWHESLYVLRGTLEFVLGDRTLPVRAGDFVHAGPGVPHTYANPSGEEASAIGLFAPATYLDAIEEIATAFPEGGGPPDAERLRAIYARWGQEVVP